MAIKTGGTEVPRMYWGADRARYAFLGAERVWRTYETLDAGSVSSLSATNPTSFNTTIMAAAQGNAPVDVIAAGLYTAVRVRAVISVADDCPTAMTLQAYAWDRTAGEYHYSETLEVQPGEASMLECELVLPSDCEILYLNYKAGWTDTGVEYTELRDLFNISDTWDLIA